MSTVKTVFMFNFLGQFSRAADLFFKGFNFNASTLFRRRLFN